MILDQNGRPVTSDKDKKLLLAISQLNQRTEALNSQLVQLGIFIEYIIIKLTNTFDAEGNPVLKVDESELKSFSEARLEEIKKEALEIMNQKKLNLNE